MALRYLILFTLGTTLIWCGFTWAYGLLFAWSEWVPGVNLVYFPHGLRMILVILFAEAGALGIVFGTAIMGFDLLRINPILGLAQCLVAGTAVWLAARLVISPSGKSIFFTQNKNYIACLDGRSLILLAFASSVLNASGHVLAWLLFDPEANRLEVRFATMFTGDLLGALILLYALKRLVISFEQRHKQ